MNSCWKDDLMPARSGEPVDAWGLVVAVPAWSGVRRYSMLRVVCLSTVNASSCELRRANLDIRGFVPRRVGGLNNSRPLNFSRVGKIFFRQPAKSANHNLCCCIACFSVIFSSRSRVPPKIVKRHAPKRHLQFYSFYRFDSFYFWKFVSNTIIPEFYVV